MVSYSNEGYILRDLCQILRSRYKHVQVLRLNHLKYKSRQDVKGNKVIEYVISAYT